MAMYKKVAGKAKSLDKKQAEKLVKQARLRKQQLLNQEEDQEDESGKNSRPKK